MSDLSVAHAPSTQAALDPPPSASSASPLAPPHISPRHSPRPPRPPAHVALGAPSPMRDPPPGLLCLSLTILFRSRLYPIPAMLVVLHCHLQDTLHPSLGRKVCCRLWLSDSNLEPPAVASPSTP